MVTFNATGFVGTFPVHSCQASYAPTARFPALRVPSRAIPTPSVPSTDDTTYYKGVATMVEADVTSVISAEYGNEFTEMLEDAKIYYIGGIIQTDGVPIVLEEDYGAAEEVPFVTGGSLKIVLKKKQY
jgi:hypothetical protein